MRSQSTVSMPLMTESRSRPSRTRWDPCSIGPHVSETVATASLTSPSYALQGFTITEMPSGITAILAFSPFSFTAMSSAS